MASLGKVTVPVRIADIVVGRATVYSDGRIAFSPTKAGTQGRQVYELIAIDFARGLSIVPITVPATPAESST